MIELEALQLALAKEEDAIKTYTQMIADHPVLKDLFYSLLSEEEKHKALIEKRIAELYR